MSARKHRVSAVMASRSTKRDGLEDFPTPPWATRALLERIDIDRTDVIWEPCANRGAMVRPLRETGALVIGSDRVDYGAGFPICDFLRDEPPSVAAGRADWIITNPPFALGMEFVHRALQVAGKGVAVLVRAGFLESKGRFQGLYLRKPPTEIYTFVHRPLMLKERLADPDVPLWYEGKDGEPGEWRKPTTATSYCWMVWRKPLPSAPHGYRGDWIDPDARARLTRDGDYEMSAPLYAAAPAADRSPVLPTASQAVSSDAAALGRGDDHRAGDIAASCAEPSPRPGEPEAPEQGAAKVRAGNRSACARTEPAGPPPAGSPMAGGETPGHPCPAEDAP